MFHPTHFVIRTATGADTDTVRRVAALDSQRPLDGSVLVGEIHGKVAAAISVDDGRVVADPFQPTSMLAAHLRVRAAGVRAAATTPSLRERILRAVPAQMRRPAAQAA